MATTYCLFFSLPFENGLCFLHSLSTLPGLQPTLIWLWPPSIPPNPNSLESWGAVLLQSMGTFLRPPLGPCLLTGLPGTVLPGGSSPPCSWVRFLEMALCLLCFFSRMLWGQLASISSEKLSLPSCPPLCSHSTSAHPSVLHALSPQQDRRLPKGRAMTWAAIFLSSLGKLGLALFQLPGNNKWYNNKWRLGFCGHHDFWCQKP